MIRPRDELLGLSGALLGSSDQRICFFLEVSHFLGFAFLVMFGHFGPFLRAF